MSDEVEKIIKEVSKQYGNGIAINASDLLDEEKHVIPLSPALNLGLHGGIPEGSWVTCSGHPKSGKEQPVSALVYTPNGPKPIGELMLGEHVCTHDGNSAEILAIYPQGIKDVYRISFSDGTFAECGLDHLWSIKTKDHKDFVVRQLKDFINDIYYKSGKVAKYSIPISTPALFNETTKEISPYIMGIFLGAGIFGKNSTYVTLEKDLDIVNEMSDSDKKYIVYDNESQKISAKNSNPFIKLGLFNIANNQKFIPPKYLFDGVYNRTRLITGILKVAGYLTKDKSLTITVSSQRLAEDIVTLVQSLGGIGNYSVHKNKSSKRYVCILKLNILQKRKNKFERKIISVKKVRKEECVCITINTKDGLYLTNNFIVTHNTLTSLSFAAQCQKPENGGRHVYYLNIEGRLKPMNLKGIAGLNLDKMTIYRSTQDKILSAKDYLNLAFKAINTHPGSLIIIDSVSALCDEKEMDEGIGYENRGAGNKLFAGFCRQAANIVPVQNCIVWAIMHLTQSQGMYGGYTEKGSRTLQYQADVQMRVKFDKAWNVGIEGKEKQIGQQVHWLIESCALGSPGMEIDSYIRYGIGIDNTYEAINLGCQLGLIAKAGAWMTLDFMQRHLKLLDSKEWDDATIRKVKTQGAEKLYRLLLENPLWVKVLEQEIKGLLS